MSDHRWTRHHDKYAQSTCIEMLDAGPCDEPTPIYVQRGETGRTYAFCAEHAPSAFHVSIEAKMMLRPGHGSAEGLTRVAVVSGRTSDVAWTRVTNVDNRTGERHITYLTESGHKVEQSDGGHWGASGPDVQDVFGSGIAWENTRKAAFAAIRRAQSRTALREIGYP